VSRSSSIDPVRALIRLSGAKPRIAVAYSGGLDSTVLAHALVKGRARLGGLRLLHVDHGLQAASAGWAMHCARQARRWRVPLVVLRASIRNEKGDSPEAAAREARYALLADALEPGEVLVTAQHRDDQAETLLLQLLRGAGVAGLAAMPPIAPFARGHIARPLLDHARAELERDARRWRLEWIEDPTNTATRFARNYLRHEVLPVLRKRWPTLDTALARSARHMAEAQALLDALAGADIARARDGAGLHVATLRALPVARRRNLLRAFVVAAGLESPSAAQLEEIAVTLLGVRADAHPEVRWSGARIRRRGGRLELEVISQESAGQAAERPAKSWRWTSERELIVNAAGDRLRLVDDPAGPIDLDRLPHALELRARVGGEHLRPGPRSRTQSLKKLLQAARIPSDELARLPLLFAGSGSRRRLVVVADRWIDASIAANVKSRHRARVRWSRQGAG
jgi:tRNA(Ile)-lysidine synthase